MADIRPFRALRYAEPLGPVVAPPYDVLDQAQVDELSAASDHNVVHLTRPGADYGGAARTLASWLASGVLSREPAAAMFIHESESGGRTRRDLVAALRLQPFEDGVVLPHERTHRGPKEDRLALFRATGASLEPLWFLYEGLPDLLARPPAGAVAVFDHQGERHTLRTITDPDWLQATSRALAQEPLLIADGHHRYETALAYSTELGGAEDAASRFTLALLTRLDDPGLAVLPTHRVLRAGVAVAGGEAVATLPELLAAIRGRMAAGTYRAGAFQVIPLDGEVPAVELHRQVIDNILGRRTAEEALVYTRDPAQAVRWVDEGLGVAAFFLDTPDLAAVLRLARAGTTMPQKTTYFHPKPPSGMAFHLLDSTSI